MIKMKVYVWGQNIFILISNKLENVKIPPKTFLHAKYLLMAYDRLGTVKSLAAPSKLKLGQDRIWSMYWSCRHMLSMYFCMLFHLSVKKGIKREYKDMYYFIIVYILGCKQCWNSEPWHAIFHSNSAKLEHQVTCQMPI